MTDSDDSAQTLALHQRMYARHAWIRQTPAVANGGRVLNVLDPDILGWNRVQDLFEQDCVMSFVAVPSGTMAARLRIAFPEDCDFPAWDVLVGSRDDVRAACQDHLDRIPLPPGWRAETHQFPDHDFIAEVRRLNRACGVAPYPEWYSQGRTVGCITSALRTETGEMVASASVADKFHPEGRLTGHVFKGSTCVSPGHRGASLGKLVNAHNLLRSLELLGWRQVLSQVQPGNAASRKTIGTCGLAQVPGLSSIGVLPKGIVFTR